MKDCKCGSGWVMRSFSDSSPDFRRAVPSPFSSGHFCLGENVHSALREMDNYAYEWNVRSIVVISDTEFMVATNNGSPVWYHFKRAATVAFRMV